MADSEVTARGSSSQGREAKRLGDHASWWARAGEGTPGPTKRAAEIIVLGPHGRHFKAKASHLGGQRVLTRRSYLDLDRNLVPTFRCCIREQVNFGKQLGRRLSVQVGGLHRASETRQRRAASVPGGLVPDDPNPVALLTSRSCSDTRSDVRSGIASVRFTRQPSRLTRAHIVRT